MSELYSIHVHRLLGCRCHAMNMNENDFTPDVPKPIGFGIFGYGRLLACLSEKQVRDAVAEFDRLAGEGKT